MKHFEEQLETEVFEANLELRNLRDESQKDDLMANRDTAQAIYNEPILFEQVSAICGSIDELKTTRDELKATSDSFYYDLVEPGPDKETLREQSTQVNEHLDKTNDEIWVNDVTCAHMTGVYTRLFAS
ncbi:hypothetical protein BASA50_002523 [Batrachochytrium salamandrivorans]|uniref:Uncharacterized protein n=1 Tax=Batrachochytrium salamandrivorans TaxID=1357716 RepID=A0ABQ8FL23_9FUNG|nr:hypothetical protein BASA50_002523 [Batrachochytrium salamandrivorans]